MSDSSKVEAAIIKATEHAKAGQYKAALELLEQNRELLSAEVEAVYVRAVCQRKLQRFDESIAALQQVLEIEPNYIRAHQELGHVYIAQGRLQEAIDAYQRAVKADAALVASWRALVGLYTKTNNQTELENAKHQLMQLEHLPPALQAVMSHLNRDNLEMADQICRQYLQQNKQDVEAMRLLASIGVKAKMLDDAEFILESAVTFQPNHLGARYDYAHVLIKRQKFGKAHEVAQALNIEKPGVNQFELLLASTTVGVGDTSQGIELYKQNIKDSNGVDQYLLLGHAQKTAGDLEGAVASYQSLYKHRPDYGDAFWSLANTKIYSFTDQELAHVRDYASRDDTSVVDKVHFNFALGKALEDRKQFDEAFEAYLEGNRLNKENSKYSADETTQRINNQIRRCDKALFEQRKNVGSDTAAPIFIVGLPRAGSTLLEQILASHSQVDGTLELPNVISLVHRLQGRKPTKVDEENRYPKILSELETDYFEKFGQQYISDTQVFRQGAPKFIDKMPNNFLHIGLIKLMMPNAKVIDARRHPMSCCFSGFKQLFAEGQEFTYGLDEIGSYYRDYVALMDHWDDVLPGFVLRVQHEDVVNDVETQVRRILDFCDLPFEQSCLEFYKTERNVRTPSSEQVRQPIYKTGLDQWRNFESHLSPLIEALGPDVMARYPIVKS